MSLVEGFGLAESAILMLVGIGKFVYMGLRKDLDKLEHRLEKMDEKYRDVTRDLYHRAESKDG